MIAKKETSIAETSVGESLSLSSSTSTSSSIMPFISNSNNAIKSNTNESLSLLTQHQNPTGGRFLSRYNSNSNSNSSNNNNIIIGRGNANDKDDGYDRYRLVGELELRMEKALALAKIKTKMMRAALVREQDASKLKFRMASHALYDDNNEKKKSGGREGVDVVGNDGCRSRSGSTRIATQIGPRSTAQNSSVSAARSAVVVAAAADSAVVNYDAYYDVTFTTTRLGLDLNTKKMKGVRGKTPGKTTGESSSDDSRIVNVVVVTNVSNENKYIKDTIHPHDCIIAIGTIPIASLLSSSSPNDNKTTTSSLLLKDVTSLISSSKRPLNVLFGRRRRTIRNQNNTTSSSSTMTTRTNHEYENKNLHRNDNNDLPKFTQRGLQFQNGGAMTTTPQRYHCISNPHHSNSTSTLTLNEKTQNCIYCNGEFSRIGITSHQRYHCILNPNKLDIVSAPNMKKRKRLIHYASNSDSNSNSTLTLLDDKKLQCCQYCGSKFSIKDMTNHLAYCNSNPDNKRVNTLVHMNMKKCRISGDRIHTRGLACHEIACAQRKYKWQQDQQQREHKKKTSVAIATATASGNTMEGVHNINSSSDDIIENNGSSSNNNDDTSYYISADTIDGKTTVTPITKTIVKRTILEDATQSVGAASSVVVGQSYDHNDNINEGDGDNADWREMGDEYYNRADDCLLF